jgi:hypothetical protein
MSTFHNDRYLNYLKNLFYSQNFLICLKDLKILDTILHSLLSFYYERLELNELNIL